MPSYDLFSPSTAINQQRMNSIEKSEVNDQFAYEPPTPTDVISSPEMLLDNFGTGYLNDNFDQNAYTYLNEANGYNQQHHVD